MAQEITIDINVVTNAAPAAAKISKELDGIKRQAKGIKDDLDAAFSDTGNDDSKIKKGADDVNTLKNALSPIKGLINDLTGGMSDAFFQAFQSVKATTTAIKGLDLALKTAAFGLAILAIQEAIKLYDQLVVTEEEEAEALTEAEAARKKYNDAILAGADALVKERQGRAGGVNQIKREIAELEASGAKSSEIYQKKRSLIEQEKQDLIAKQEAVRGQAQAEKDVEQALLDNASALRALDLANKKANNDRKKEEAKKAAQDRFDILNRENVRREEALKTHEENVARIATAARDKRIADAKFIADFEHDADMEAFNNELALQEQRKALGQKRVDDEKKIQDAIAFAQAANLANLQNTIGALGSLFEEGTAASKAAAIAQIAIGTGVGFVNGLDIAQKSAKGTGPAAAFAFPLFYAAQISAVLAAAGQAKRILTTVKGGGGSPISATAPSVGATPSAPTAPQFNIVGQSGTNQLAEGIGSQFNQPVRAYVVGQDVTTSQQLQRQRVRTATFG